MSRSFLLFNSKFRPDIFSSESGQLVAIYEYGVYLEGCAVYPAHPSKSFQTVLNINWRDHVPNVTLYGDLPRLTDRIAWRRLGIAGHCYRHRELPASQLVLWEPTHGRRKPGRPPTTFLNIVQDDIGATTSAELPACMKDRKDWNLRREARLRPP